MNSQSESCKNLDTTKDCFSQSSPAILKLVHIGEGNGSLNALAGKITDPEEPGELQSELEKLDATEGTSLSPLHSCIGKGNSGHSIFCWNPGMGEPDGKLMLS